MVGRSSPESPDVRNSSLRVMRVGVKAQAGEKPKNDGCACYN